MLYTKLGRSGLRVSRLALGCMSFGESARGTHAWTLGAEESERILGRALDLGINFLDTANIYSQGSSEEILGNALFKLKARHEVVLATKVYEAMTDGPLSGGLSRQAIFREVDASLKRLRTDYIDLYIVHRWDYQTPILETMEALHDLVKMGKVRYIGASSMHAWQFVKAQYLATLNGWTRFVSMQSHYNLLNREEEREMQPYCVDEGVGLTPWSPLARGKLARVGEGGSPRADSDKVQSWLYQSAQDSDRQIIAVVEAIARERGVTKAQVALAWLLRQPAVASPIIGVTCLEQLDDLLGSLDLELEAEELARLAAPYTPHAAPEYV
ncbi:aldo/keto reductase [Pseudomonas chlororaphis]|uniref:aldo/keto reductase n=1 Tax=Pseudomonas chlororaphis TaxID=587753 RepID=UPI0015DDE6AB|nr:aldo/keto reductase [Pseudomonas chlororaphis]QLL12285.1 aldo/keto reductase [Pseudomonas chlororaphis subsp. aurantiaca]